MISSTNSAHSTDSFNRKIPRLRTILSPSPSVQTLPKIKFTTPVIQQYQNMVEKYKKYMENLAPTINHVYEKQNFRNYLTSQKLNKIKDKLLVKKDELEKQLAQKMNPLKLPNGQLYKEIFSLNDLQGKYKNELLQLQKKVKDKKQKINKMVQISNEQQDDLKNILKSQFGNLQEGSSSISSTFSSRCHHDNSKNRSNYISGRNSNQNILRRLSHNIEQKWAKRLTEEQQKLMILKLFTSSEKLQQELRKSNYGADLISVLQKEIGLRQQYIRQIDKINQNTPVLNG